MRGLGTGFPGGLLSGLFSAGLSAATSGADEHADWALEEAYDVIFTRLYFDLCDTLENPFDWTCRLERPRSWQFRRRAAYWRVWQTFIAHGFLLTDDLARRFYDTPGQTDGEDCGAAYVRRLREVWEPQLGVPYGGVTV